MSAKAEYHIIRRQDTEATIQVSIPVETVLQQLDVVYREYAKEVRVCIVPPNLVHIMIVSDRRNASRQPLAIHNIGAGVREEDRLFEFKITGHYRIKQATN